MGEKLDGRSDIFSLGVVRVRDALGRAALPGPNVTSILYKLVHVDPIEPAEPRAARPRAPEVARGLPTRSSPRSPRTATRPRAPSCRTSSTAWAWWSGLAADETLTLQVVDEPRRGRGGDRVTWPRSRSRAAPLPARRRAGRLRARAPDEETIVLAPAELAVRAEPPSATVTLVLDRPAAQPSGTAAAAEPAARGDRAAAARDRDVGAVEDTMTLPPGIRQPPPLPPATAPSAAPARIGGAEGRAARHRPYPSCSAPRALLLVLLALAGWELRPRQAEAGGPAEAPDADTSSRDASGGQGSADAGASASHSSRRSEAEGRADHGDGRRPLDAARRGRQHRRQGLRPDAAHRPEAAAGRAPGRDRPRRLRDLDEHARRRRRRERAGGREAPRAARRRRPRPSPWTPRASTRTSRARWTRWRANSRACRRRILPTRRRG